VIGRRAALGLLLAPGVATAQAVPPEGRIDFRVLRNGALIGTHTLAFGRDGGRLDVHVNVALAVGFGPITFYRYRHEALETWQDDVMVSCLAETDDDGAVSRVAIRRAGTLVTVEGGKAGRFTAPPETLPATHWNRRMLDGPFVSTQTAELMRPKVENRGREPLPWTPARTAERMVLSGDVDLETWYDGPAWMGLRFKGKDGSALHYERVA
jgi:hypothetical protein